MDQILPFPLWVGHAGDGANSSGLFLIDIETIVQVALEEPPLHPPREFTYLRFPLIDGGGNDLVLLKLTITTLARLVEDQISTLVCCGAGMSRSPAMVAAALAITTRRAPEVCLREVMTYRHGDVSPGLWTEVLTVLKTMAEPY